MTIINREQIPTVAAANLPYFGWRRAHDLADTARAYYDLKDRIISLHREDYELGPTGTCRECLDDYPCPTIQAVENIDPIV